MYAVLYNRTILPFVFMLHTTVILNCLLNSTEIIAYTNSVTSRRFTIRGSAMRSTELKQIERARHGKCEYEAEVLIKSFKFG